MKTPDSWKKGKIGDVVVFEGGTQPPQRHFAYQPIPGYVRMLQIRDYKSDRYATYIPAALAKNSCDAEDVMIGRYGPPVFQILRGKKGSYNVALIKATPDPQRMTKEYLYLVLQQDSLFRLIDSLSRRSAGQAGVDMDALRSFPLALPPLAEQNAIAAVLSAWDRAIEQTTALVAAKERLKQGLMQQLLTGERRFKGFKGEWNHVEIGHHLEECASRVNSTTDLPIYTSSRGGLKPQGEYYGGRNVTNDGEYGVVPNNCFVFRHMSDDGLFVFHINRTGGEIAVSKEYPVFRAVNLDQDFLLAKLNHSSDFKAFALSEKAGGTRTRLYFSRLQVWKTSVPSRPEQRRIAEVLTAAEDEIKVLQRRLGALKKQKKGLMQKLLTGEVRVSDKLLKQGAKS